MDCRMTRSTTAAVCDAHYQRSRTPVQDPTAPIRRYLSQPLSCTEDDCYTPPLARGLCPNHYQQWRRGGPPPRRNWTKFWRRINPTGFCWEWVGQRDRNGYGRYNSYLAHRQVWESLVGPIPDGLVLDHLCRVRHCVNPDHLDPVTPEENNRRGFVLRKPKELVGAMNSTVKFTLV